MSPGRLVLDQLLIEQKRFWRNPASAVFTFAFPILFLVVLGSLNKGQRIGSLGGVPFDQFFTPNIVAFGLMSSCLVNLAINLPFRRDAGLLKRARGTPLPTWVFMGGIIGNAFLVSAITTFIVMLIGIGFYDVQFDSAGSHSSSSCCWSAPRRLRRWGSPWRRSFRTPTPLPRWSTRSTSRSCSCRARSSRSATTRWPARIANLFPVRHFLHAIYALFDPVRAA